MHTTVLPARNYLAEAETSEPRDIRMVHSSPLHTSEGTQRFSVKVLSF